jgi:hypothetical protein
LLTNWNTIKFLTSPTLFPTFPPTDYGKKEYHWRCYLSCDLSSGTGRE